MHSPNYSHCRVNKSPGLSGTTQQSFYGESLVSELWDFANILVSYFTEHIEFIRNKLPVKLHSFTSESAFLSLSAMLTKQVDLL